MNACPLSPPRLLVSVRSAAEAALALKGGCDVLDVKEPARGALGMADTSTIAAIAAVAAAGNTPVPVSVALGEACEWSGDRLGLELPAGIAYVKLGTAQLHNPGTAHWRFAEAQEKFAVLAAAPLTAAPHWIAVAYADHHLAGTIAPEAVADLACDCHCVGLLVDTYSKQQRRLVDWLDAPRLTALGARCRELGLQYALAGRLQLDDLPAVLSAQPEIVGIRSAACRDGERNGPIDTDAIRSFRQSLHDLSTAVHRTDKQPIPATG
ncbi:MAG: hypothetical protein JSS02_26380 [Planctomycetes bacterium]|nr:hypothetical protein [Planctomycetota bacterium]